LIEARTLASQDDVIFVEKNTVAIAWSTTRTNKDLLFAHLSGRYQSRLN
jgi:hypothetical protein